MVLNGDGKTNIKMADSLESVNTNLNRYSVVMCNPPFGVRIKEKRVNVLNNFDLGHVWTETESGYKKSENKLLDDQECGILFAELCVKICNSEKSGRIGLILPNGYLGNRSLKYKVFRDWLLRHTRICSVIGFPRFTFKSSGADVSASVLILEKRQIPLASVHDSEGYNVSFNIINNVGWDAGTTKGGPIYHRDSSDGTFIVGDDGKLQINSDFECVIDEIRHSMAADDFSWLTKGIDIDKGKSGWTVDIENILNDSELTIDPKHHCQKRMQLIDAYMERNYVNLGDIVDFYDQRVDTRYNPVKMKRDKKYGYVDISHIGQGDYEAKIMRGWQLPDRAKHFASEGDIYFGAIWSSVDKWCYVGKNDGNIVVTNGCLRFRLKSGKEDYLQHLVAFMCTEGWTSQLRGVARGSDGLAEISVQDAKKIIIPIIEDEDAINKIKPFVEFLKSGRLTLKDMVTGMINEGELNIDIPQKRGSHIELV